MTTELFIIGNGGLARELKAYLSEFAFEDYKTFISDEYHKGEIDNANGIFKLSEMNTEEAEVIIAIADPKAKKAIVDQLPDTTEYFTFIHPTATIYSWDTIGDGTIIGPSATITTDVVIGKHCLINCNVTVGHDAELKDFCTVNPGASISGNVILGECVYVGSSASVREKLTVADNTTIGMGAAVVKNINTPNEVYVGVPARRLAHA